MLTAEKHKLLCRFWFEPGGETTLERGRAQILDAVKEVKSYPKQLMEQECPTITGGITRSHSCSCRCDSNHFQRSVEELDIKARNKVEAVIKVTEVMVAK